MAIEIIGSLSDTGYSSETIERVLLEGGLRLTQHGDAFTGRPGTRMVVHGEHVIKLRTEINPLTLSDAKRFVAGALAREREIGIHHPSKTWFLLPEAGTEVPRIANITPRLAPLHESGKLIQELGEGRYFQHVCALLDLYLKSASEHQVGLDISLSNFAVDTTGHLYYVDDDIYGWDEFHSLTHFLGILVRILPFTEARIDQLAACTRQAVLNHFRDPHWISVIAEDLRSLFVAEERKPLLKQMVKAITEDRALSLHVEDQPVITRAVGDIAPEVEFNFKIALMADIHANSAALERVLAYMDDHKIERGYVLGDVVGYGPNPVECIELLRARPQLVTIKGNHDHAVASGSYGLGFSSTGRHVVEWTAQQLDASARQWLSDLPLYITGTDWLGVHGSPNDKTFFNAYVYDMTYEDNLDTLEERRIRFCFHGHSHLQKVYYRTKSDDGSKTDRHQDLTQYISALVCPGSVGQPRSGIAGTEFALLDLETWGLEFLRLDYDILRTVERMRELNFPTNLADRLLQGT